jgi:hypothetical protein
MEEKRGQRKLGSVVRQHPLVLFLILGALLYSVWAPLAPPEREIVRIEATVLRALEQQQEDLLGRPLTDEEKDDIRESYIDDEVLLREAIERGLQWSDFRVRQRLTRIMRGALTETVADPSVAQLQAYFRDNIDRYSSPESTSLEQVFFPWGEEVTEKGLDEVLTALRAGADPEQYGSPSMLAPRRMPRQTRASLVRVFGADFANAFERLEEGEWHGPLESVQGVHLLRVTERHPPEVAVFENVEHYLRQEWLMEKTRELQQEGVDEIRSRYRIELVEESAAE